MSVMITIQEREELREQHVKMSEYHGLDTTLCSTCVEDWPCAVIRLLDALEAAEAQVAHWQLGYQQMSGAASELAHEKAAAEARAAAEAAVMQAVAAWDATYITHETREWSPDDRGETLVTLALSARALHNAVLARDALAQPVTQGVKSKVGTTSVEKRLEEVEKARAILLELLKYRVDERDEAQRETRQVRKRVNDLEMTLRWMTTPHEHRWAVHLDWSVDWGFQPPDQDLRSIRADKVFCAVPGCTAGPEA